MAKTLKDVIEQVVPTKKVAKPTKKVEPKVEVTIKVGPITVRPVVGRPAYVWPGISMTGPTIIGDEIGPFIQQQIDAGAVEICD